MNIAALIDYNCDDVDSKIYTDFQSFEFGNMPTVNQLFWGEYHAKPLAQTYFEQLTKQAIEIASTVHIDSDYRPRIKDLNSGLLMLVDTGAA